MPAVREYFSLCLRLIIAFGVVFELPIAMVFAAKTGAVDAGRLAAGRKYALRAAFVVAAVVTPTPDVVNQVLMALPMVVLYEIGILAVRIFGRRRFIGFDAGSGD
jgi:sec-independent protein translocase protein TatC